MTTNATKARATAPAAELATPHGGALKNLQLEGEALASAKREAATLPAWDLTERQSCDVELLVNGAFSPLDGFLVQRDYESVVADSRLANGTLWPIPIVLDVTPAFAATLAPGKGIALRDAEGTPLAILDIASIWTPDRGIESDHVYGTRDTTHPGVDALLNRTNAVYLGGRVRGLEQPRHFDFRELRDTPASLRAALAADGWTRTVAFQTRNPIHRAHFELTKRAAEFAGAKLLLHPVVGLTKPGDVDHFTRVRAYQAVLPSYAPGSARLSLLPLAMRMAGPREALWHAIIRKNHGVTHFIIGRDHAGPGKDREGRPFYPPLAAQELVQRHEAELGIAVVAFPAVAYAANRDAFVRADEVQPGDEIRDISGTELRQKLQTGGEIPAWFSFPRVVEVLRQSYPRRNERGVVLFFTGLSGAGKSTLAQAVISLLLERSSRPVTLLDGDLVRKHLSKGLGFSCEDRDANVLRIGFVASEIARHGGIAVAAPIAPYAATRAEVRRLVEAVGDFVEVHVATSLEVCESRDRKGLYAKARAGELKQFTGIDDPYEAPEAPELRLDTANANVHEQAAAIVALLVQRGVVA